MVPVERYLFYCSSLVISLHSVDIVNVSRVSAAKLGLPNIAQYIEVKLKTSIIIPP